MAYATGTANDLTALRSALFAACTANGWMLSGEVLHKGSVHVRVQIVAGFLTFYAGNGIDGSNNITDGAPSLCRIGRIGNIVSSAFTWPLTYEIHVHADEVYLVCNYNIDLYQWAAFGQSTVQGLSGTGVWCAASAAAVAPTTSIWISATSGQHCCPALFYNVGLSGSNSRGAHFIHHGLDGLGWSDTLDNFGSSAGGASFTVAPLASVLPNAWNGESVLLPIQVFMPRAVGGRVSLVADLADARYLRIDNQVPGEIISLGPDKWKVYPWYKKNSAVRDGGNGVDHTGTFGWAIRYDGP